MSYPAWQPWEPHSTPSVRASHADRERAVDVLKAGLGEGRLEQAEFERRVTRAYAARTVGELARLVADLPQGPVPPGTAGSAVPSTFVAEPRARINAKAVGSAICGALCLVTVGITAVPAVILGHMARAEIRSREEEGDWLALTGLALGWLSIAGWLLVLVMIAVVVGTA
ncbi:DUF1707 and DUF4190 domain-containing protein [Streptomyces cadmiisoli]|uniref:DUF1707 and DUF4190 domain-containing protein n=1 Tax=Streptomyces cadmiisoli TaxID=2184053 RepID=UPI003D7166C9